MTISALFGMSESPKYRWDDGAVAVEAAFILPVLFLLILGIIKFGMAFWQWNTMLLAVEQAGRYVMINNTSCDTTCAQTQMQTILTTASSSCPPAAGQICVSAICYNPSTCTPTTSSTTMKLTATYSFNFFGLATPFTISTQGTVPLD